MKTIELFHRPFSERMMAPGHKQRGVVLFVALIVLVAMSLAGVSMMRAVDTGTQVAGNLVSRESAANAADPHFETALAQIAAMVRAGLSMPGGTVVAGYNALAVAGTPETRNWTATLPISPAVDPNTGNKVEILIDRLCSPTDCEVTQGNPNRDPDRGIGRDQFRPIYQHFRTLARVTDPKGMVTYIEFKND